MKGAVCICFVICTLLQYSCVAGDEVVALKSATFAQHIKDNKQTLIEFYAPWCGHCKKLEPEFEKAAVQVKPKSIPLAKVDATEEKDLANRYNVKGFPTMIWFEEGKDIEYDGGRTSETIVEWITSMIGVAVTETEWMPEPIEHKPTMVLQGPSLLKGYESAAKANRRKAVWYYVKGNTQKVTLQHKGEDPVELGGHANDQDAVTRLLKENILPLFGKLDGDTWDKYMEAERGIVWSLFPHDAGAGFAETFVSKRPLMSEVAKQIKPNYFVTMTDTVAFREAVENMLSVTTFPAIAVQKKAGDKKKYVYDGEMTSANIVKFIRDVDAGNVKPKYKTEPQPDINDDPVKVLVSTTLEKELFQPELDVLLLVYATWCGHCKKLDPEYQKLAKKIKKEGLADLLSIAKIDGTANDSPIDSVDWTGFPTIYYAKAGTKEATVYEGERTAKGLWKYIKKHATKADEIRRRIEARKHAGKRGDEL